MSAESGVINSKDGRTSEHRLVSPHRQFLEKVPFGFLSVVFFLLSAGIACAQGLDAAEKGLTLIQKINAGGVPLISLVIAALCGAGFYWQLKRNIKQNDDHLSEVKASATAQLTQQGELLREMLDRDREGQEAHGASTKAIEGVIDALKELRTKIKEQSAKVDNLSDEIGGSNERTRQLETKVETLSTELRLLREELRGQA